jgi:hypothetical protein
MKLPPRVLRASLIALTALMLNSPLPAETYVVDGARGNDDNDGISAPFATIARGTREVGPGDTLRIVPMDEPYRESLVLRRHGLRGAPIVIEGGGAILTGADPAPADGWTQADGVWRVPLESHRRMMVFGEERHFLRGTSSTELDTEQWFWEDDTFFFRPAEGKTPADYDLRLSIDRSSGVVTTGAGFIIVRDLTCINFWNDGFNLHGGTGPIWFENIVGNWNGDEGFSAHENTEAYVHGGEFSHNYWHGINDIQFSRTHFVDVVCRDNRSKGVRFNGGIHSLIDCEISGSPVNVELMEASRSPLPGARQHPLAVSFTNLRNVIVRSEADEIGVLIRNNAQAAIEHCLLIGGAPVVQVEEGGRAHLINSVVSAGTEHEVITDGEYFADHNLYHPGRFLLAGVLFGPEEFEAMRAAREHDENSLIAEPVLHADGLHLSPASPGYRGADSGYYGGFAIGPENRREAVSGGAAGVPIAEGVVEELPDGGRRIAYDFEAQNPWSRVFPEPERNAAGIAVGGASELSDEQARSGERSARLHVTAPDGEPARYNIKLFSVNLPFDRPIRRISYWLFGDGSGRRALTRIRDRTGESFYDAPFSVDWEGWREVTWDVSERPPARIGGGDGNLQQDGPTMELVVEISLAAGEQMTLFFDDLEVELEP